MFSESVSEKRRAQPKAFRAFYFMAEIALLDPYKVQLWERSITPIKALWLDVADKSKSGIYRLWFGDKYYLGSTTNMKDRISQHISELRRVFRKQDLTYTGIHLKSILHLIAHPEIESVIVELVRETNSLNGLIDGETEYLTEAQTDIRCLNVDYDVKRKSDELNEYLKTQHIYTIDTIRGVTKSVYKLFYGDHYVVMKAKDMKSLLYGHQTMVNRFLRGAISIDEDHLYYYWLTHIKDFPGQEFSVELLVESEDAYTLLKCEQEHLDEGKHNPLMLNNATEAYIGEYNEDRQTYGWWLPKSAVLNYKKWLKARRAKYGR